MAWYRYVLAFEDSDRGHLIQILWQFVKTYALWLLLWVASVYSVWWIWSRYYKRFITQTKYRRNHICWRLLDHWLHGRGIYRQKYQPLRAIGHPDGISEKSWLVFVSKWEAQAYGYVQAWGSRELKRHLSHLQQS